jgi:hypothetical protein
MRSGAPHALANRQRVGRAGSYGRDMPRLPCFPQALGRCLCRRCGFSCGPFGIAAESLPGGAMSPGSTRMSPLLDLSEPTTGRGDKSERTIVSLPPLPRHAPSPSAISGS